MRQIYIKKFMMKSKRIDFFFKRNACDENEKIHLYQLNLKNFMRTQELKKMKNNSLKFLELYIINLKKNLIWHP